MKVVVIAIEVMEVENNLIDKYGKPYIGGESFPCGGGLDKRCTYNGDTYSGGQWGYVHTEFVG